MEELAPTIWELMEQQKAREEELIERRKAEGHPDPWDGKAPTKTIHDLERRRYLDEELTPEEKDELQELAGLYPDAVEKMRVLVQRRYCGTKRGQEWLARTGDCNLTFRRCGASRERVRRYSALERIRG